MTQKLKFIMLLTSLNLPNCKSQPPEIVDPPSHSQSNPANPDDKKTTTNPVGSDSTIAQKETRDNDTDIEAFCMGDNTLNVNITYGSKNKKASIPSCQIDVTCENSLLVMKSKSAAIKTTIPLETNERCQKAQVQIHSTLTSIKAHKGSDFSNQTKRPSPLVESYARRGEKPAFICVATLNDKTSHGACTEYYSDFKHINKVATNCTELQDILRQQNALISVAPVASCPIENLIKGCVIHDQNQLKRIIWWYKGLEKEVQYCSSIHKGELIDAP